MEKPASFPSLKALLLNRPLFEEPLLNDPNEDVISSLGSVYEKEVTKKVLDLLKDSTPFQLATSISNLPYLDKVLYLLINDFKWVFFFFFYGLGGVCFFYLMLNRPFFLSLMLNNT